MNTNKNRRERTGLKSAGIMAIIAVAVVLVMASRVEAHEERASQFPAGTGEVPVYRTERQAAGTLVVCKPDSAARVAALTDHGLRRWNTELLARCGFEHLQAAVDAVAVPRTNIYVLPGSYREEPSWSPPCIEAYGGGIVGYELIHACGEVTNLVTVAGDDPADGDIACDGALCHLQIEGTGARPDDVVFTGGFGPDGDWVKHNIFKADRADGIYLKNMAFQLASENAVYVHETDGYVLDGIVARNNELYGILTFASDHGLINGCDTHHNGDSGVYPGSAADVNAARPDAGPLERWSVEVTGCDIHHNGVGLAGTAGNSLYVHGNQLHHNGLGIGVDSYVDGHPGMPQDHAWIEANRIYANNENFFVNVQGPNPPCRAPRPVDRGYQRGLVCPTTPVPVGTGVLILGGNANLLAHNEIFDNWRYGVMLSWVPGALRGDFGLAAQLDTSHNNEFRDNRLGLDHSGARRPNGLDIWWDDQGVGNCWEGNVSSHVAVTSNALLGLPSCYAGGSILPAGNVVKTVQILPCAQYNRRSQPDPPGCDWLRSPPPPPPGAPALLPLGGLSALQAGAGSWPSLALMASSVVVGVWRRPSAVAGALARRPPWSGVVVASLLPLLMTGCLVQSPRASPFSGTARLTSAAGGAVTTIDALGDKGTHVLHYQHGEETQLGFTVTAQPGVGLVVSGARLDTQARPLAVTLDATVHGRPLPAEVAGGESAVITLRTRSDNCRYYQEREAQTISSVLIDVVNDGQPQTWRVPVDRDLLVRSPMIVGCPDRTLDRSDDTRTTPAVRADVRRPMRVRRT